MPAEGEPATPEALDDHATDRSELTKWTPNPTCVSVISASPMIVFESIDIVQNGLCAIFC